MPLYPQDPQPGQLLALAPLNVDLPSQIAGDLFLIIEVKQAHVGTGATARRRWEVYGLRTGHGVTTFDAFTILGNDLFERVA